MESSSTATDDMSLVSSSNETCLMRWAPPPFAGPPVAPLGLFLGSVPPTPMLESSMEALDASRLSLTSSATTSSSSQDSPTAAGRDDSFQKKVATFVEAPSMMIVVGDKELGDPNFVAVARCCVIAVWPAEGDPCTAATLRSCLEPYGEVIRIKVKTQRAVVVFASASQARRAAERCKATGFSLALVPGLPPPPPSSATTTARRSHHRHHRHRDAPTNIDNDGRRRRSTENDIPSRSSHRRSLSSSSTSGSHKPTHGRLCCALS